MKNGIFLLALLALTSCTVVEEAPILENSGDKLVLEEVISADISSSFYPIPSLNLDEAMYLVENDIKSSFFNLHAPEFLTLIGRSEEDSHWRFQSTVWLEAGVLLDEMWAEYPDQDTEALAKEVVSQMFQRLIFSVDSADFDEETEDILVEITVFPMSAVDFADEETLLVYFTQVTHHVDVLTVEMENYVYYDNLSTQGLLVKVLDNTQNMEYAQEQAMLIRLVKEDGGYQVDLDDWYQFREYTIDYQGHYG